MATARALRPREKRRFKTLRTIFALLMREMAATYGRSVGGYFWAVAEPVAGIALLSIVFSLAFRNPPIGTNFAIFYTTGLLPLFLFNDVSAKTANSLVFSKQLLAYPGVTFIDTIFARFILSVATHFMIFVLLTSAILEYFDIRAILNFGAIFRSLAMAAAFGLGVGTLNCFLFLVFPIWRSLFSALSRPLFLVSCVLFLLESVPDPYRWYLWFNPVAHVTGEMRNGFYAGYDAVYVSEAYVFGVSGVLFVLGLLLLKRFHSDLLNR